MVSLITVSYNRNPRSINCLNLPRPFLQISPLGLLRERKVDPFKLGVDRDDGAGEIIVKDKESLTGVVTEGAEESSWPRLEVTTYNFNNF